MNKTELVVVVANEVGLTQEKANETLNKFIEVITRTLAKNDEKVVISGFGTFEVRNRVARRGKNPRSGEEIEIPAQKSPAFKAGKLLKEAIK